MRPGKLLVFWKVSGTSWMLLEVLWKIVGVLRVKESTGRLEVLEVYSMFRKVRVVMRVCISGR